MVGNKTSIYLIWFQYSSDRMLHKSHNFSTKVIRFFVFFGGEKEGSNLAHLHSDYVKEEYKSNSKTRFSIQINLKLYINLNVARESSPFMKISSTLSSPK